MTADIDVVNVFDLMSAGRFVRHQECQFLKRPGPESTVVLLSHRWERLDNPDPRTIHFHGAVRFVIQACMMASGSTPNVFNSVDFSELELCGGLWSQLAAKHRSLSGRLASAAGRREFLNDRDLDGKTAILLDYLQKTIGDRNTQVVAAHARVLACLMRDFDLWYDYTSMPQKPRSPGEQDRFRNGLRLLHQHFSQYWTAILWSARSLKRGWCFMEAAISYRSARKSIFSTENSLVSSDAPAPIYESSFMDKFANTDAPLVDRELAKGMVQLYRADQNPGDLTTDLTTQLGAAVHSASQALSGKTASQVFSYLEGNGYSCTEEGDLQLVAQSLAAHFGERGAGERVSQSTAAPVTGTPRSRARFHAAYVSLPDGDGAQWAIIAAETTDDRRVEFVWFVFDDIDGLRQWNGRLGDPLAPAQFSQFIQQLGGDPRTILAEAHLSFALPLVQQAIKGKSPAKLEIARWRHILECEPPAEEDTCRAQLAHLRDGMVGRYLSLLGQTPSILAAHPIFKTWVFRAVSDNDVSTEVAYTPISSYTPELAIELWVTDKFRAALERRLESCAYVFLRTGQATTAHLCLAAAHSIRVASPALTSNPFLIAMAHQSIRQS